VKQRLAVFHRPVSGTPLTLYPYRFFVRAGSNIKKPL